MSGGQKDRSLKMDDSDKSPDNVDPSPSTSPLLDHSYHLKPTKQTKTKSNMASTSSFEVSKGDTAPSRKKRPKVIVRISKKVEREIKPLLPANMTIEELRKSPKRLLAFADKANLGAMLIPRNDKTEIKLLKNNKGCQVENDNSEATETIVKQRGPGRPPKVRRAIDEAVEGTSKSRAQNSENPSLTGRGRRPKKVIWSEVRSNGKLTRQQSKRVLRSKLGQVDIKNNKTSVKKAADAGGKVNSREEEKKKAKFSETAEKTKSHQSANEVDLRNETLTNVCKKVCKRKRDGSEDGETKKLKIEPEGNTITNENTAVAKEDAILKVDETKLFHEWRPGKCRFQCEECQKVFDSSIVFWHHVDKMHDMKPGTYKENHERHPRIVTKRTWCKICNVKLIHDHGKMLLHMNNKHDKLDLFSYFQKYILPEKLSSMVKKESTNKVVVHSEEEMVTLPNNSKTETTQNEKKLTLQQESTPDHYQEIINFPLISHLILSSCIICKDNISTSTSDANTHMVTFHNINLLQYYIIYLSKRGWMNACLFQCRVCQYIIHKKDDLKKHQSKEHPGNKFGPGRIPMKFKSTLTCPVAKCRQTITHTSTDIKAHMEKHSSKIISQKYRTMILNNIRKQWDKKIDNKAEEKDEKPRIGKSGLDQTGNLPRLSSSQEANVNKDDITHCDVRLKPINLEISRFDTAFEETQVDDGMIWLNHCVLECLICSETFPSIAANRRHVNNDHNMSYKMYVGSFGLRFNAVKRWTCRMCGLEFINDTACVQSHLESHWISLKSYDDVYENDLYPCKVCGYEIETASSLSHHIFEFHAMWLKDYDECYGTTWQIWKRHHMKREKKLTFT